MTLSLAAVFIRCVMQGVLDVCSANLGYHLRGDFDSGMYRTLTPMLCSRFLRVPPHEAGDGCSRVGTFSRMDVARL